jgi:hypothetical protein
MVDTRPFAEYKQYIERLSSWLASTNANIHEVLQSVNKQRALLIIKVGLERKLNSIMIDNDSLFIRKIYKMFSFL